MHQVLALAVRRIALTDDFRQRMPLRLASQVVRGRTGAPVKLRHIAVIPCRKEMAFDQHCQGRSRPDQPWRHAAKTNPWMFLVR